MKLQEKFEQAPEVYNANFEIVKGYEQIADEFAIGFADWCKQEYELEDTAFHNKWLDVDGTYVSSKKLLEIYKKEKKL